MIQLLRYKQQHSNDFVIFILLNKLNKFFTNHWQLMPFYLHNSQRSLTWSPVLKGAVSRATKCKQLGAATKLSKTKITAQTIPKRNK